MHPSGCADHSSRHSPNATGPKGPPVPSKQWGIPSTGSGQQKPQFLGSPITLLLRPGPRSVKKLKKPSVEQGRFSPIHTHTHTKKKKKKIPTPNVLVRRSKDQKYCKQWRRSTKNSTRSSLCVLPVGSRLYICLHLPFCCNQFTVAAGEEPIY